MKKIITATPGDEEVLLSWSMPEGWNPTDFIVYYTNTDSKTVTRRTGGLMNCTVTGLANGTQYTFYVQAVYGENISNYVGITGKPSTSRFPVTDRSRGQSLQRQCSPIRSPTTTRTPPAT